MKGDRPYEHATEPALGTNSEVGQLRTVIVHRPDEAHERLSPSNAEALLFDDVIWVRRARQEHDAFVDLMRERDVEVLLFHDLLAETLEDAEAREVAALPAAAAGGGHGHVRRPAHGVDDGDACGRARIEADRRHHRGGSARRDRLDRQARVPRPSS